MLTTILVNIFFSEIYWLSSIGLGLTVSLAYLFIDNLGKTFPILELSLLLASMQWIIGPFQDYRLENKHYKYFMYVDESTYMTLVVPSMILFSFGALFWVRSNSFKNFLDDLELHLKSLKPYVAYMLMIGGFACDFLQNSAPGALAFVFFLLSNLKYIGSAYYLYGTQSNARWYVFWGILGLTFISSIKAGMFHDFFLWSVFLFSIAALRLKLSLLSKIFISVVGLFGIYILQSVKGDYREIIWKGKVSGSKYELFFDLVINKLEGNTNNSDEIGEVNTRLNQGWIISAIMKNVPVKQSFAQGETIEEAIYASVLPRFLNPEKKQAGGRENFKRFTGLELGEGTSMGTSIIGEAYANFGNNGTYVFMLIWGLSLSYYWRILLKISKKNPTLILWIPILFLQVVKAETELVVVLNHLVKSSMLVFGVFWISRNVLKVQL